MSFIKIADDSKPVVGYLNFRACWENRDQINLTVAEFQ
jgi:hypothetical protein